MPTKSLSSYHMIRPLLAISISLCAYACSSNNNFTGDISKQAQRHCEQQALIAQQTQIARTRYQGISSPSSSPVRRNYTSHDEGKWVFDHRLRECVRNYNHNRETTVTDKP